MFCGWEIADEGDNVSEGTRFLEWVGLRTPMGVIRASREEIYTVWECVKKWRYSMEKWMWMDESQFLERIGLCIIMLKLGYNTQCLPSSKRFPIRGGDKDGVLDWPRRAYEPWPNEDSEEDFLLDHDDDDDDG